METQKMFSLKANSALLDASFEGYKLSLDKLPIFSEKIAGVLNTTCTAVGFSYMETRLLSLYNHAHQDSWHPHIVYYFSPDGRVNAVVTDQDRGSISCMSCVLQLATSGDDTVNQSLQHFPPSISFCSQEMAVVVDGYGRLLVLETGDRSCVSNKWKTVACLSSTDLSAALDMPATVSLMLLSAAMAPHNTDCLHLLTCHISDHSSSSGPRRSVNCVSYVQLAPDDSGVWTVSFSQQFYAPGTVHYACLDIPPPCSGGEEDGGQCQCYMLLATDGSVETKLADQRTACSSNNCSVPDSLETGGATSTTNDATSACGTPRRLYVWRQTDSHVTVLLRTSSARVLLSPSCMTVLSADGQGELLRARLTEPVEPLSTDCVHELNDEDKLSHWRLPDHTDRLEVRLCKKVCGRRWSHLMVVDENGASTDCANTVDLLGVEALDEHALQRAFDSVQQLVLPSGVDHDNQQLSACTPDVKCPCVPAGDMEECDAFPADNSVLMRINCRSGVTTHQCSLGAHQFILSTRISPTEPACLCVRHDVDGVVWQPRYRSSQRSWCCEHVGTLSAIGYVQVSKTQRKFSVCPADLSYTAICDAFRHIYIYHQPSALGGELRNRTTGQRISQVCRQQVVSLDDDESIVGVAASHKRLLVLTKSRVHSVVIH